MKALTLYAGLTGTGLWRLFSALGTLLCLCEFLSFYFTLFTPLLISPHPPLSHLHKAPPLRPANSCPWLDQPGIPFSSLGLVSLVWSLYLPLQTFYSYLACNTSRGKKKFYFSQVILVMMFHISILHYIISHYIRIHFTLDYGMSFQAGGTSMLWFFFFF